MKNVVGLTYIMAIIDVTDGYSVEESWGEFDYFEENEDNEDIYWLNIVEYDEDWNADIPDDSEYRYQLPVEYCYGNIF